MYKTIIFAYTLLISIYTPTLLADQTQIRDYHKARNLFWNKLYPNGGYTLYCGKPFKTKQGLNIEHIYPASWAAQHLGCGTRRECQKSSVRFNHIEADLHNLWPLRADVNRERSNHVFAEIQGEIHTYPDCDFETTKIRGQVVIEVRKIARGNVARSIFYMEAEYGLPVAPELRRTLIEWNRIDPPTIQERKRNILIEHLQGTRNKFIDHYNNE